MDVENTDFTTFVTLAERAELRYMLTGGLALLLNGAVRFTQDANLWIEPTNENRDRFIQTLLAFGYDDPVFCYEGWPDHILFAYQ